MATLPPIIMVQWKITLNERNMILEGDIFHFHDDGRKGNISTFWGLPSLKLT